uniref:C-type lectin domain-containing protein n=1 Tax=Pygocentrus nattereri TaxID=42514 RepID=A0A3B4CVN9_PYGNA
LGTLTIVSCSFLSEKLTCFTSLAICFWYFVLHQENLDVSLFCTVVYVASYLPHRYHFVNQYKTWTEGQSYCRQTFTDLATINNPEEMNMVKSMLQNKVGRVWIGLNRVDGQKWLWSLEDGSSFINGQSYNNWYTGEPNNGLNRNSCVFLWGSDGNWVDDDCTNVYNFVCYTGKNMHFVCKNSRMKQF